MEWPWIQGRALREGCDLESLDSRQLIPVVASYFELISVVSKEEHEARAKMKAELERVSNVDLLGEDPPPYDPWSGEPQHGPADQPEVITEPPIPGIREMPLG